MADKIDQANAEHIVLEDFLFWSMTYYENH